MEDFEHKIFVNDVNKVNFQEHTYCQVEGEPKQNGRQVQLVSVGVQTMGEDELLTEYSENDSNTWNRSNLNETSQIATMDNYAGKIIGTESNPSDRNLFQSLGDFCPDSEEGDCVGDLQNITLNWPPIVHRRKSHKSYLATWSAQISCDGFAKCLIETCNFISLNLQTMQDHYKTCNGVPNYDFNSCSSCSCWLPTGNELAMHESSCKGKKRDPSMTLPKSKDLNEAETNQSEIKDDNHISSASPQGKTCGSLSAENSGEMPNEERQMKYCDECDIEFLSDTEFSQHLICKKNWVETSPVTEKKREATSPVTDTSQEIDADENNHIIQPGRPIFQGEYVRRRSFTKQHKVVWEAAIKKHKYVKCLFQNCHFLGLSVRDMIYHYGYCNGDGTFAKFVCQFCGGRLTQKDLLDIHIQRSHANERIDENKFPSTDIQNEDSHQPPASDNNESSGSDPVCFAEFDPDFPLEAPLEVEITEESTPFDWQDKSSFPECINEEGVGTSVGLRQSKKSKCHPKSQKWGIAFGGSRHNICGNNSRDSVAGVLNSLEEDNFEHSMVDTSQANARKNQNSTEIYSDRDYREDHIYSKVKIRTIIHSEPKDSLSVKKRKNLKHYPGKKRVKGDSLRVKGEETVFGKKSDSGNEIKEESQLKKTVSVSDASGKNAGKMPLIPIPASQSILKRDVLPYYTSIWKDSLETNGFARCLVATCNFISLDILHVQNHFKNCNGVPEKGPNLCTFCDSRLPSTIELGIHKLKCKANREANPCSSGISQSSGECKKESVSKNRTGESSNAGEMENPRELNENENKTREESDSLKSNKDAAGGEVSSRKESTNFLRIGEIMKLKNKQIVDYNRIIQPGPVLPEGHYLRRRSYSKTHKAAWEAALEKHKYVKCLFQNCHFLAMCLEDMIYHFGYCIGDGSFAKFECPHCGGRLTSKVVLDIHIQRSHSDKLSKENDQTSNEEGTEVLLCTLDDWKKLMAKKEVKTYAKNSPQLSIVLTEADKATATENPSEETRDKSSSSDAPPSPKRKCRIRTGSEEVGESSDVNNSTSDSKNNACDSSANNQTRKNNYNNNSSGSKTSRARNPHEELRYDEGGDEETQENTDNPNKTVPAAGEAETDDLVEMPGKGDVFKDTSDNQGRPESTSNSRKNSKINSGIRNPRTPEKPIEERKSSKGNLGSPEKSVDERKRSHGNSKTPEKPIAEGKSSKGNPSSSEKPIAERKSSKANLTSAKKPVDEQKRSDGNPKTPEKPIDERRHSHGNPGSPEKSVDKRKRFHGSPKSPEKPIAERKFSKGNLGTTKKPIDERMHSQENPGRHEKQFEERKSSKENPKTPEKSVDERRHSQENPSRHEKPIEERKSSKGNPKTPEKSVDEQKRSQGNLKAPEKSVDERRHSQENPSRHEKPIEERKSSKGNPKTPEKSVDERKRSQGNPKAPEKPIDEQKGSHGNPKTIEKPIDERRRSHGNADTPEKPGRHEKPIEERKSSKGNPKILEKSVDEQKRSQGNPKTPEKSVDERKRSQGNPKTPEKPIDEQKGSHGNPKTLEKPIDERRRSHGNADTPEKPGRHEKPIEERKSSKGNPKILEKSVDEQKRSQGNPKTPEKSVDERKRSQGNPKTPEKPIDEQKGSHGNPKTLEKPIDERRRSHGNADTPEKPGRHEKPIEERKSSKGNPKTPEKSVDEQKRSQGNPKIPEKSVDERKRSQGNPKTPEKAIDERRHSQENPGRHEKSVDERRHSQENIGRHEKPVEERKCSKGNPKAPEKPIDEQKGSHGNPKAPEKSVDEQKRSQGNPKAPEKSVDEQKRSQGNPKTPEKSVDEQKRSQGNPKTPEKAIDERRRSQENPGRHEKAVEERKSSKGNPKTPEKLIDERRRSHGNADTPERPENERKSSKGNLDSPEKPNDEQKLSHGSTNTSSLVLERNSNTIKQETEKERKSLRQSAETNNMNSNKNDQETKHDVRPRRKRGRSFKPVSQEDLLEEEDVEKVLDSSGAEGTIHEANDHDDNQKPPAKFPKIEPLESESNLEETLSPTIRKRGRPPKRTSLRCKVSEAEAKGGVEETPEQGKRGGSAKKIKSEPEEKQILEQIKVKCASCDFECERRLFTDHNHKKHAGLGWIEGENPIDLNDEDAVSLNVKQAFRHVKSATCGKCGSVKKSALGFISHVQNCGKSEEEKAALKVSCPHCPARILKYSLPVHLKLYHFDSEGNKSSQDKVSVAELPMKRKSALRAVNKFCEVLSQEDEEEETKKKVQFVMYEKGKSKLPKLPGKTKNLWMKMIKEKKKIPCRRGSCLTESSSVQEARNHHFMCSELPPKCYVCERCDFFTESKSVIQEHVDIHPKMDRDYKLESEEEKSEDEAYMRDAEDDESESLQKKPKTVVTPSDDTTLEATLKARFFAREGLVNVRQMRFCRQSLRMTLESEMEEVKKYGPVFPELRTQASDWSHVEPENATDHFPSLDESISFRVNNMKNESESDWKKLKRFEGEIVEESAVIFTGGSILSMSWCKYSCLRLSKENPKQYLAVSSSKKMDKFQNIHEERGDTPCLIQIYNCGEMSIHNDVVEVPELAMGIVHEYGEVWDLAWFPLDAYEHSENETFLTRIGLLGAACQDGTIKIWPICDPDELKPKHSLPLYKTHPKAILELEDKADVGCLRLAIGRTGTVVGGYAGGLVAVWNLKTISSPFSKTDGKSSILKPIVSFQAHKTSITALSMCQNSDRYICTSGLDRFIKFWDLESPGNPFESLQKEVCLDNVWPKHWPLTISTLEDILPTCGKGMIKAVRELYCDKHRSPLALEGTCWSLSFNEWLNILCGCNNIGEVKIRFLRNLFLTDETFRHRTGNVVCHTELKFLKDLGYEKVEEKFDVESCKGKSKKNEKKVNQAKQAEENTAVPRTYEEAWKYFGLIFHDPVIEEESKQKTNTPKTSTKANQCLEDYPITSVNKVCWNPNYKRFMQLAIGHHCGLIRIKPVKDTKCNEDVLRFLAQSDDEIGKSRLE